MSKKGRNLPKVSYSVRNVCFLSKYQEKYYFYSLHSVFLWICWTALSLERTFGHTLYLQLVKLFFLA